MEIKKVKKYLLDFIFPIECLGCGKEGVWLCPDCFSSIPFSSEQSCVFCRKPVADGSICHFCKANHYLDQCLSAGNYSNEILSRLVKTCKYSFAKDLAPLLGKFTAKFLKKELNFSPSFLKEKGLFLVPIPLHQKRFNWRNFNQSEFLAKELAKEFNLKILTDLSRIKNNIPQAKLGEEQRRENLSGCFYWSGEPLDGKKIILVDDVATTGTTLDEAAKILKEVGAKKVLAITAAGGG